MAEDDELLRIPIFPLENVVLFPRVQVPLHIFEPRYRQMTRAALEGGRRIGMVVVRPDATSGMTGNRSPKSIPFSRASSAVLPSRFPMAGWGTMNTNWCRRASS